MAKRLCPHALSYDDVKNSLERHISHEDGKQLLANLMNTGGIASPFSKLRLKCKLSGGRIEVPVRSVHCTPHFDCFDLRNYLDCETKNCATTDAPSTKKSRRPVWACPVCGERAAADDLRVDDYFAHILASVPASVDEVPLLPDGSFEQISHARPEVTIDDDDPFKPQQQQLRNEPSGPSRTIDELLKQSKAFQGTLQNEKSFRTKKDLREAMESFLEEQRDTLSALLKKLNSANQDDVVTCSVAAKKLCLSDSRALQAEEPAAANGNTSDMEVVEVDQQPLDPREKQYALIAKRLEVVAYAKEHGNSTAAANFGYIDAASVKKWRKKEAAYERELAALRRKNVSDVPKALSQHERDRAYRAILKRLKEDTDNVWPFLDPVPNEVELYYDVIDFPICLADVELKVEENEYHDERLFIVDMILMFSNCYRFNGNESPYYEMGYNLNKKFLELCKQHFRGSTLMPHLPEQKPEVKKP